MNFGDPLSSKRLTSFVWKQVQPCPMSGCWLWTGKIDKQGYGRTGLHTKLAHRVLYVEAFGEHAHGLELDHKCRVRCCCNPHHLEAVTHRVNMLRGETIVARCAKATHCPKGHPYDDENTRICPRGHRRCRACHRNGESARARAQRKAAYMANPGARPTGISTPASIVRYGLTSAQRVAIVHRDAQVLRRLAERYDREFIDEVCALCDRFVAKAAKGEAA